ncbi:MAG: hypothetical protein ACYC0H_12185 [Solirubrobacteraceae bacterium]
MDECHHVPAVSIERLLREIPARFLTGLTATPQRRDGHHPILSMQCGPVRHVLTLSAQIETATRRVLLERRTRFDASRLPTDPGIQEILSAFAEDHDRTEQIAKDVLGELAEDRYPLVLHRTTRTSRCDRGGLGGTNRPDRRAPRSLGVRARRRAEAVLSSEGQRAVLATGRYIGEASTTRVLTPSCSPCRSPGRAR